MEIKNQSDINLLKNYILAINYRHMICRASQKGLHIHKALWTTHKETSWEANQDANWEVDNMAKLREAIQSSTFSSHLIQMK